ncbi:hypothetical protein H0H92_000500 [Tricholoma furcatifolium]|nr:hypothetical protein H0H92_000500 [Tricholoma furcatifolium]
MRNTSSQHKYSVRDTDCDLWPRQGTRIGDFRPHLNFQALCELLQIATSNDAPEVTTKGKKRYNLPPERDTQNSKRVKLTSGRHAPRGSESTTPSSTKSEDFDWHYHRYPPVDTLEAYPGASQSYQTVPVLQHVFEIQYTREGQCEEGWELEEDNLLEMLADFQRPEPRTIYLGDVNFTHYRSRLVVFSPQVKRRFPWCLLLPSHDDEIDLSWYGLTLQRVQDLLVAVELLRSTSGRTAISGALRMHILPSDAIQNDELPFRLEIEVDVSLRLPAIFEALPSNKGKLSEVEEAQRRLLAYLYPLDATLPESYNGMVDIPFFYSTLQPAPALATLLSQEAMQPVQLQPTLLPFQRRSVGWLLAREGKQLTTDGEIAPNPSSTPFSFWEKVEEGNVTWYYNPLSGLLSPSLPQVNSALGGILAEEPGLGKTLESISLILLNPAPIERNPSVTRWDPVARLDVKAIKTTLIVTPPALATQWADELAAHAPSLKVLKYDGWSKVAVPITQTQLEAARVELTAKAKRGKSSKKKTVLKSKLKRGVRSALDSDDEAMDVDNDTDPSASTSTTPDELQDWCSYVHGFDVVITTYAVLRSDFNVALAAPVRPRREDVIYSTIERTRSPLVLVEWYRVIMDEVQMVGGGKVEDMVSLIPRLSSFAVSGTPARQQVNDLIHVLKFLRVEDVIGPVRLWSRLLSTGLGAVHFSALFQEYGIRTLKATVKDELTIPQQTRYLVSIALGPVEKHVYDQALEVALEDLGLDARGVAASEAWQIDGTVLRAAIRRLRGICTHPQVGQLNRPGEKLFKPGTVKTIHDVLQNMRDTNWRAIMDNRKAKVLASIRVAQLQAKDENDFLRFQHALNTLIEAERDAQALVDESEAALDKYVAAKQSKARDAASGVESDEEEISDKAKGKRREASQPEKPVESDDESEDEELEEDLFGINGKEKGERSKKRSALQNRLRECRIVLHKAKFLQGDMFHSLDSEHSAEEDAAYGAAEAIRRGLLKGVEDEAIKAMDLLTRDADKKNITSKAIMVRTPFLNDSDFVEIFEDNDPTEEELNAKPVPYKVTLYNRAVESMEMVTEVNGMIKDVINSQSALLWEWRVHLTALLTQKLASSEDSPDGEEYQRTLDSQGEVETYLKAYVALLSDRRQSLLNERTLLAAHDVREKKLRHTKAAMHAAGLLDELLNEVANDNGGTLDIELQPEHEVLYTQLSQKRKEILQRLNGRSLKSVLVDINAAATRITKEKDPLKVALKKLVAQLRQLLSDQGPLMDKLDADLVLIRKAFNQRILYFRQLQEISDTVAEVEWEGTVLNALFLATTERDGLDTEINQSRARQRYLDNLTKKGGMTSDEDDEACILCRCDFVRGFITQCVSIDPNNIQRFTVKADERNASKTAQQTTSVAVPKSRRQISYNMIDTATFAEINSMESFGDYGSKIQTLVRHLLYLKAADPDAKSIVFSAWADSLFSIRCLRIDQKSKGESAAKRFKSDPEILVLLLHGERENAGLNITCASRVFLLESVVHHGFEVQAIARIDRMGQTRPTEDTVERNILDLAARQGLSLYTKDNFAGTLNVSTLSTDSDLKLANSPKKLKKKLQKGDFIFKMDDMLAILFPHMYEDIEFLISEDAEMGDAQPMLPQPKPIASSSQQQENAVAGPSRLW